MVKWISHRGESIDAPENTLPAFKLAFDRNTDGFETDVHLTADKVLVCCHDSDTWRTCQGVSHIIEESNWDDIKDLDASYSHLDYGPTGIPRFAETLKYLGKGKTYFVEIKENNCEVMDIMLKEVDEAGIAREQIVMISFHAEVVRFYKKKYPEMEAYWLTCFGSEEDKTYAEQSEEAIKIAKDVNADGVDLFLPPHAITKEFVQRYHDAGLKCAVWTVDQCTSAKKWADAGVDAVTSNCAAKVRAWVESH